MDRSRYYIIVRHEVSRAMHLEARDNEAILGAIILASLTNSYVEGSAEFMGSCSGQTVRNHLRRQDPSGFVRVNDDVVAKLGSIGAFSGKRMLAIDTHDIMYYGDPGAEGVVGTQPKKGSHWAYKFGSIAVLLHGERLTLAAVPVLHEPRVEHVRGLIEHALSLGIKPKLVLLDAAYNSAGVVRYLNSTGMRYIIRIASPIEGIRPGDDFVYRTRGHRRREDEQATFRLVAINGRDRSGKVRLFVFATNTDLRPRRIRRLFRRRWGIESAPRNTCDLPVKVRLWESGLAQIGEGTVSVATRWPKLSSLRIHGPQRERTQCSTVSLMGGPSQFSSCEGHRGAVSIEEEEAYRSRGSQWWRPLLYSHGGATSPVSRRWHVEKAVRTNSGDQTASRLVALPISESERAGDALPGVGWAHSTGDVRDSITLKEGRGPTWMRGCRGRTDESIPRKGYEEVSFNI